MTKPYTTLFLMMSLDGKISTGASDQRDFDRDFHRINGLKEGVGQYYALEEETDLFSLNSGRVMAKVGWNNTKDSIEKLPVSFIIIDNKPHLTRLGVENLLKRTKELFIATTNKNHPVLEVQDNNLHVMQFDDEIDFVRLFESFEDKTDRITVQSGGELNSIFIRAGLIDEVSIVVAPVLVGGKDTSTLVDGKSLETEDDLDLLKLLELIESRTLNNSFLHLRYKVINQ